MDYPSSVPPNPQDRVRRKQEDVDAIKRAITTMATGQREVSVRFSDGSAVTYETVQLPMLEKALLYSERDLRDAMQAAYPQRPRRLRSIRMYPNSGYGNY